MVILATSVFTGYPFLGKEVTAGSGSVGPRTNFLEKFGKDRGFRKMYRKTKRCKL